MDFPCGSAGKESACNAGDLGSSPGLGRSPGEGKGYPLQYSGLEHSIDCSPWGCKELDMTFTHSFDTHGGALTFVPLAVENTHPLTGNGGGGQVDTREKP